ncbi:MAG: glycosyltransferase family 39 protein [Verrucomicrobiota bacterium]
MGRVDEGGGEWAGWGAMKVGGMWQRVCERYRALDGPGRRHWWFVGVGFLMLLGWIFFLREVEHPWEGSTAKRVERGDDLRVEDYVQIYFYWAGVVTAVVWAVVLASSWWWWRWAHAGDGGESSGGVESGTVRRWHVVVLLGIVVLAAAIRVPTMDRGLNRDEQDNLRRSIHGYHEYDKEGSLVFRGMTWQDAFFENRLANNPVLFGVLAKTSLGMWRGLGGGGDEYFSRTALRAPSLVAGLGSIVAMWWFLVLIGMPRAALVAAFMATVHPFHIDYSVQARGYGLVLMFVVLAGCFAVLAVRDGKWRHWVGYGACLFSILYSFPGAIYFVGPLGLGVAWVLVWRWWKRGDAGARVSFVRMSVVGVVTLMCYYQMMSPLIPQATEDLKTWEQIPLNERWRFVTYTKLATGAGFLEQWEGEYGGAEKMSAARYVVTVLLKEEPLYVLMAFAVIPLMMGIGLWRFWRCGGVVRVAGVVALLAPVLAWGHHHFITHFYYYYWYLCYSVPWIVMLGSAGMCGVGSWLGRKARQEGREGWVVGAVVLVFAGMFVLTTWPGKSGRHHWVTSRGDDKPFVVPRGKSAWVVYGEGRMLKIPVEAEVPAEFPGEG